jgi:hypothetical protein
MRKSGQRHLARFVQIKTEPEKSVALRAGHEAVTSGTTLFPTRIHGVDGAKRFLISGHNNGKIGKVVLKGEWAGFPVFTLTLTERATCPRSCAQWQGCYGNGMPYPHRWDHTDALFLDTLRAEAITLCRLHPEGLVVRLHVLGDFYSMAYLRMWIELVDRFPQLHIYGYTARRPDADDPESRAMAEAIERVADAAWDQFAIRFSHPEPGPGRSIVVDEDPKLEDVIVCPAQLEKTTTCGTCGLCWAPAARHKTIAFLRHGMKRAKAAPAEVLHRYMLDRASEGGLMTDVSFEDLGRGVGVSSPKARSMMLELQDRRLVQMLRKGAPRRGGVYRVFAEPQAVFPPAPALPPPVRSVLRELPKGRDPLPKNDATPVRQRKPDEPLMPARPHAHDKGGWGWGRKQIGTAGDYDLGTPEQRIAKLPQEELDRIAAQYGATVKKEAR